MRTLAVVPARGGSKGLPGKNARPFLGIPLLERAILIGAQTCDKVVVTTDSGELAELATSCGIACEVHFRPPELATDEAPMLPVVQDAIRGREGDVIVLLQPTQPLRTAEQVRGAIQTLLRYQDGYLYERCDSVISVRLVPEQYWPDRVLHLSDGRLDDATDSPAARRQDARVAVVRDGTVYATRRAVVDGGSLYGVDIRALILPGDALSIDTLEDFERLEAIAQECPGCRAGVEQNYIETGKMLWLGPCGAHDNA